MAGSHLHGMPVGAAQLSEAHASLGVGMSASDYVWLGHINTACCRCYTGGGEVMRKWLRRVSAEHASLSASLPPAWTSSVFLAADPSRLDVLRYGSAMVGASRSRLCGLDVVRYSSAMFSASSPHLCDRGVVRYSSVMFSASSPHHCSQSKCQPTLALTPFLFLAADPSQLDVPRYSS